MRLLLACLLAVSCGCASVSAGMPAAPRGADSVDYACRSDADCAIKDVGNCCGRYPACVNRDSPTFPERVRAECAKRQEMGICGFPEVTGCRCVDGRCSNVVGSESR